MESPPQVDINYFILQERSNYTHQNIFYFFQSTQSPGKIGRQVLADNAAKWSREQRAAQEVLMENIKSGGNGLTVRTVVSGKTKTAYIIHNGIAYYACSTYFIIVV